MVAEIPAKAIAEAPIKNLPMRKPDYLERVRAFDFSQLPEPNDYGEALLHLLSSPNIASKAWVYEQYDHMVQINTVIPPGAADAAVLRLKDWDERLGIAVTADCNSSTATLTLIAGRNWRSPRLPATSVASVPSQRA